MRSHGSSRLGGSFDEATIASVWRKGEVVVGVDPTEYRKDACGAWMQRSQYGKLTNMGWEVDHIVPVSRGGWDLIDNLQPLQWQNNRHKADSYPYWTCAVKAS